MDSVLTVDDEPRFEPREGWGALPDGWRFVEVAGVATDSHDRVFVFNRGDHPVIIFDREGRFIGSWGENLFARPHGITIGPDDAVYCTDDLDHTVKKFTPAGDLVRITRQERMSLGHRRHQPGLPHDPPRRPAVPLPDEPGTGGGRLAVHRRWIWQCSHPPIFA